MQQHLFEIKANVDLIVALGSPIDSEGIMVYTLNGLPPSYQVFNTAIRTSLQSISQDYLYSLLCNKETIQNVEAAQQTSSNLGNNSSFVLLVRRSRGCRFNFILN